MIWKWVRDLVGRFSFIDKIESKNHYIYLYYKKDDVIKSKRIPFRASRDTLIKEIEDIKKDINYYNKIKVRDYKLSGFAFSEPSTGETDGKNK